MQDSRLQQTQIYNDFGGLNALKTQARTDKSAALKEVAKQFESLFLSEMVKSMRKVNDVFAEGNYLNTNQSKFYQDMFDNQLTLSVSENQGFGLAEVLERQMSRQIPGMTGEGVRTGKHKASLAEYDRSLPSLSPKLPAQVKEVSELADSVAPAAVVDASGAGANATTLPARFESPEQFVRTLLPMATEAAGDSGIDPRVMVAQAALETGWGKHMIEGADGAPSFNLFGIKADSRWDGGSVDIMTTEYREGLPMNERAAFRSYDGYSASFSDYVEFLNRNPRYRDVLAAADRPEEFADRLQAAGYATDPNYGAKIRSIMNSDTFDIFDTATGESLSMNPPSFGSTPLSTGNEE
ncbi:flagellar assembly peptidoglycan hydrolase FlgJ [Marinobacter sp. 1Y8]